MTPITGQPVDTLDQYRQHVRHLGLSRDAETALLASVRDIMSSFVERAFEDDPIQHVQRNAAALAFKNALADGDVIDSSAIEKTTDSLADAFTPTVAPGPRKEE